MDGLLLVLILKKILLITTTRPCNFPNTLKHAIHRGKKAFPTWTTSIQVRIFETGWKQLFFSLLHTQMLYTNTCKVGCVHTLKPRAVQQSTKITLHKNIPSETHNNLAVMSHMLLVCFYLHLTSKSQSPLRSELPFPFSALRQTENNMYLVTSVYPNKQLSSSNSALCTTHICQI